MSYIILLTMLFLHLVDDYYLQGLLAKFKQQSWWKENAPDELYKNDYIIALLEHAFSWTFVTMLPITICLIVFQKAETVHIMLFYIVIFSCNWVIHAYVDHLKANIKKINLIKDQVIHVCQIIITWSIFFGLDVFVRG